MSSIVYTWKWNSTGLHGVCTKYKNLYKKQKVVDFVNNFSFSLYTVSFTCYIVTTSEKQKKFKRLSSNRIDMSL